MTYTLPTARTKGGPLTRVAMLLMAHKGDLIQAENAAGRSFPTSPEIQGYLKSAIAAGSTADVAWAASLNAHASVIAGFVDLLRNASVIGRLQGLRSAPFNTRTLVQTSGSKGAFVGEGRASPIGAPAFETTQLWPAKYQCTVVFSSELVRVWTQASEDQVRTDMVAGASAGLDRAFLDPTIGAEADPPSITHGIVPKASTGSTVDAITADLKDRMAQQISYGNDLSTSVWVMSPRSALHISTLRDSAGQFAFPGASVLGGSLLGLPLLVSGAVALAGSPNDSYIVLLNPRRILLADEGLATIDVSEHTTLQMLDAPVGSPTGASNVSLWQLGLSAVRVTRILNFKRAADDAVSLLSDVQF
jgi:HK97 family phage major capsid protein